MSSGYNTPSSALKAERACSISAVKIATAMRCTAGLAERLFRSSTRQKLRRRALAQRVSHSPEYGASVSCRRMSRLSALDLIRNMSFALAPSLDASLQSVRNSIIMSASSTDSIALDVCAAPPVAAAVAVSSGDDEDGVAAAAAVVSSLAAAAAAAVAVAAASPPFASVSPPWRSWSIAASSALMSPASASEASSFGTPPCAPTPHAPLLELTARSRPGVAHGARRSAALASARFTTVLITCTKAFRAVPWFASPLPVMARL
mmetsp:Transcript_5118/g.17828  ORF Transcript_5118/g.17828 Transcript_5118/m.17828 type:complete len:262 (-) Transcript_5118:522-1307(-)